MIILNNGSKLLKIWIMIKININIATDLGVKGAEVLKDSAEKLSKEVISKVETDLPDVVDDVKKAFTDFASSVKLPIDL